MTNIPMTKTKKPRTAIAQQRATILTDRPKSSYNRRYLMSRDTINAYQDAHKNEIRNYMMLYMRAYRLKQGKKTLSDHQALRYYLTDMVKYSVSAIKILGINKIDLALMYGYKNPTYFYEYVKSRELDHCISRSWIKSERPELIPYIDRYYNIQFLTLAQNRKKGNYTDMTNPKIKIILNKMEEELQKDTDAK